MKILSSAPIEAPNGLNANITTATTLQTPRLINGVAFDGSQNITLPPQVFIQNEQPTVTLPSIWIQTGLGRSGEGFTLWSLTP